MSEALDPAGASERATSGPIHGLLVGCALVVFCGLPHANRLSDVDTFWHLAAGEEALDQRVLWLTEDVFTYTVPEGQRDTPPFYWAFQMLLALAGRAGGLVGVQALVVLLATAAGGLLFAILRRFAGASPVIALAVAVTAVSVVAGSRMVPRPQLVQMLAFLTTLWLLEDARRQALAGRVGRRVFLTVPVFLVWANFHGPSLIMGCLLYCSYLADALWRWVGARGGGEEQSAGSRPEGRALGVLAGAFAASVLASLVSPAFVQNYLVLLGYAQLTVVGQSVNIEYQPLWSIAAPLVPMAYLALGIASIAALRASRTNAAWWLATLGFTAMCLRSSRLIDLATFCAALPLAAALARIARGRRWLEWVMLAAAVALLLGTTVRERRDRYGAGADDRDMPVRAVEWVLAQGGDPEQDRLFCDQYFGGYVSWSTRGRYRISWDGRTWLYYDLLRLSRAEVLARFPGHVLVLRSFPIDLPTGPEPPLQPDPSRYAFMYVDRAARVYLARPQLKQPMDGEFRSVAVTEAGFQFNPAAPAAALAELERMADSNLDNPAYFFGLGMAHMQADRLADAESAFGEALQLQPGSPGALTNLAAVLIMQERFADAITRLDGAERSEHFTAGRNRQQLRFVYLNRALAQQRLGQNAEARRTLEECLEEFPADAAARTMLEELGE